MGREIADFFLEIKGLVGDVVRQLHFHHYSFLPHQRINYDHGLCKNKHT